jgi:thymidylate synthase
MYISAETLDDLLHLVYKKLLRSRNHIASSKKGANTELSGVLLKINNPRTRLSLTEKRSTLFTCLGEFLWYLAGSNQLEFIRYYIPRYAQFSDDNKTIYGGYGPRIRGTDAGNQIATVIDLLKNKPESRQAVIQLFDAADLLEPHKDIPCTCTLQFLVRKGRLHLLTTMRSNDAYWGLPHDVFAFTMLQEIMARSIGAELGTYKHAVGSLHLYDVHRGVAEQFLEEGWQSKVPMPPMPQGDPWPAIETLLEAETIIRCGGEFDLHGLTLDPYWKDLIRILQIFRYTNSQDDLHKVAGLAKRMSSTVYAPYIRRRHAAKTAKKALPEQLNFFADGLNERVDGSRAKDPH